MFDLTENVHALICLQGNSHIYSCISMLLNVDGNCYLNSDCCAPSIFFLFKVASASNLFQKIA